MNTRAHVPTGTAWYLISLRPSGAHDPLRRAGARFGARTVAVSPWRLQPRGEAATREQLEQALSSDRVVFTSPAAADAAGRLLPLAQHATGTLVAVGEGTARALRRQGVDSVHAPARMDSEGLLALPAMADLRGRRVALITAPGGRGMIAAQVQARGARLVRVDVYERVPLVVPARTWQRLAALEAPAVLAVSSGEALLRVLEQLPDTLRARWQRQPLVAASARLAELAGAQGFIATRVAAGPLPGQLAAAAHAALFHRGA
ncbi:uroporphyrinogen-III synthase [Stenotrophomonas mori]|uniref:Uroporphyrinogen-III synthase n=1 Tax=Stenotrophomonas mori TaxID=2871096 RepID=A0ABT0SKC4_9GAMM|nr:uroporphyrinogen-III synthase [Stenotrophomonas mori]MCL7715784.1 uroporphyrinogen-III synthase [Stenotrophomonas mori]